MTNSVSVAFVILAVYPELNVARVIHTIMSLAKCALKAEM